MNITLDINERTHTGQRFIRFIGRYANKHKAVRIEQTLNSTTVNAIREVQQGKGIPTDDINTLFDSI